MINAEKALVFVGLILAVLAMSILFVALGEKENYDMENMKIAEMQNTIDSMNKTLNEINARTTMESPVSLHNYNDLQAIIEQCFMTQGSDSQVCKAEMNISKEAFNHPIEIDTTHGYYYFTGDSKTWCMLTTGGSQYDFVMDLNYTQFKVKCDKLWSQMN